MAKHLYKTPDNEIEQLKNEATNNGEISEEQWATKFVGMMRSKLLENPKRYRSFGPYWWQVKQAMLDAGFDDFGTTMDLEWYDNTDFGDRFTNCLMALEYSNYALDNGLIYSNTHNVLLEPDNPDVEPDIHVYTLADDDMEIMAMNKR